MRKTGASAPIVPHKETERQGLSPPCPQREESRATRTSACTLQRIGIGAGTGAIVDRHQKKEIKADVEDVLPPGSGHCRSLRGALGR
jgi:hypothetical protein